MANKATIKVSAITKRFNDIDAVRDVTFSVAPGEVIGFVGPNGAGKTTTLSILMGYLRASKGSVSILGQNILPESAHKAHSSIGFVAGDMALPHSLTGDQYLRFNAGRHGRVEQQYTSLLKHLQPVLDRPIGTLSRGNKQKIALIGALQHEPRILLLDEPTSGLDPLMQDVFLRTIRAEANKGVTVIMSSHILSEVASICSRILFMRAGRLVMDKSMADITSQLGKHITVTSADAAKLTKFLPEYATLISHKAQQVQFSVPQNNLQEAMRWLSQKPFTDLSVENKDLDDVFHELYKSRGKH